MQLPANASRSLPQIAFRSLRYGYFPPLQALRLTVRRPGGHFRHWAALYRMAFDRLGKT